jgi:uncharacterized protein (UPF0332 family)
VKSESLTLIQIAKNDFEAAKILLERRLYSQAIFMLQQSLEKAIKSLLLKFGIVNSEMMLKKDIGHNVVINTLKLMKRKVRIMIEELQNIRLQYKNLLDLQLLLQKIEEDAKFACEMFEKESTRIFGQLQHVKNMAFEPLDERNKKIINDALDYVFSHAWSLTLPYEELYERIALIKSNEEHINELLSDINLAVSLALLITFHIPFDSSIVTKLRYKQSSIEENTILFWWSKDVMNLIMRAKMFERIEGLITRFDNSDNSPTMAPNGIRTHELSDKNRSFSRNDEMVHTRRGRRGKV